jgi:septum formation protein
MKLVLASASPRRRELLKQAGIKFTACPVNMNESFKSTSPEKLVVRLAHDKAMAAAKKFKRGIILGADTIVVCDDQIMGKPSDKQDAKKMLKQLSANTHKVMTGLALVNAKTGKIKTAIETTKVTFRTLSTKEIDGYISTGEYKDKAGAYGIQGRAGAFVERIDGCYSNVVGLPLSRLVNLIKK